MNPNHIVRSQSETKSETTSETRKYGMTKGYKAPERVNYEVRPTRMSDVYEFSSLMYKVVTGKGM